MGKYTAYSPKVEKIIDLHLKQAVDVLRRLNSVKSIIVAGGFGRGEGSVRFDKKTGKYRPINDYDLFVFVDRKIPETVLNKAAKRIETRIGSTGYSLYRFSKKDIYFDIRQITANQLKNLLPAIKYYELKHGSKTIFGPDLLGIIPDFSISDLPLSDGMRFILNRISHITEWFSIKYVTGKKVEPWEKETLIYDMIKTYLECCLALSLVGDCYHVSYQKRFENLKKIYLKKFSSLNKNFPNLLKNIEFATYFKLKPKFEKIKDVKKFWLQTRKESLGVLFYLLEEKYQIANENEFSREFHRFYFDPYFKNKFRQIFRFQPGKFITKMGTLVVKKYLMLIWFFRVKKEKGVFHWPILLSSGEPGLNIFSSGLYLIQGLNDKWELNGKMLARSYEILKKIYPIRPLRRTLKGYDQMRVDFANAWRLYYFQKLGP